MNPLYYVYNLVRLDLALIPFLKDGAALQVFVKCNLIRHKLEVYATNKETFSIRNGIRKDPKTHGLTVRHT